MIEVELFLLMVDITKSHVMLPVMVLNKKTFKIRTFDAAIYTKYKFVADVIEMRVRQCYILWIWVPGVAN